MNRNLEIDPDQNFFDNLFPYLDSAIQSKYYDVNKFNSEFEHNLNDIFCISYNIRSFERNIEEFISYISQLNTKPKILIFTETWYSAGNCQNLDSYRGFHITRPTIRGGGVSVYIHDSISCKFISNFSICNEDIEICTVELNLENREITLFAVYRPHSGTLDNFSQFLFSFLESNSKNALVLGDFNVDILRNSTHISNFIHGM